MSIEIGDQAPHFELPCKPGETVNLTECLSDGVVVLLFFPLAFSPVCTEELCTMRDSWNQWETIGAKVLGISVDSPFVVDRFRQAESIPFPILSDFNKTVSRAYGALHENLMGLEGVSKRAAFVIDPSGAVVYRWVSDDPGVQVDFAAIAAAARKLATC